MSPRRHSRLGRPRQAPAMRTAGGQRIFSGRILNASETTSNRARRRGARNALAEISAACAHLGGISPKTLYAAVRNGKCQAAHIGAGRNRCSLSNGSMTTQTERGDTGRACTYGGDSRKDSSAA